MYILNERKVICLWTPPVSYTVDKLMVRYTDINDTMLWNSWRNTPVGTGRKLNVHKTFRRRPGRLLNVLCTFNLRPVSTGLAIISSIKNVFLQVMRVGDLIIYFRPNNVQNWWKFLVSLETDLGTRFFFFTYNIFSIMVKIHAEPDMNVSFFISCVTFRKIFIKSFNEISLIRKSVNNSNSYRFSFWQTGFKENIFNVIRK